MVLIVPNTYLVSIKAESGGQPVVNVLGVRKEFSGADEITETVAAAWSNAAGPKLMAQSTTVVREISAMFLGQADGEVYNRPVTIAGTKTDQKSTNGACALVTIGGASRSPSTRGRVYFGPLGEPMIDNDGRSLAATVAASIKAAFESFKTTLAADGMEWVVVSRKNQSASVVSNIAVQSIIATQRRRIR